VAIEHDTVTRQLENAATTAHECGQALPEY
jgi:hypothetical protein